MPPTSILLSASDLPPPASASAMKPSLLPQPPPPPPSFPFCRSFSPWRLLELLGKCSSSSSSSSSRLPSFIARPSRSLLHLWLIRLSTIILLWTCFIQLVAIAQLWRPHLLPTAFLTAPYSCFLRHGNSRPAASSSLETILLARHDADADGVGDGDADNDRKSIDRLVSSLDPHPHRHPLQNPLRISMDDLPRAPSLRPLRDLYRSNGFLLVSCNGGLNQMRAAICDMVAIAGYLNLTLFIPELDKSSFWADPSDFGDIFNVDHFIESLKDEVRIIKELPEEINQKYMAKKIMSMPPISWSNESYYMNRILPIIKEEKALHFNKTDARLANNGLPLKMQKLRCRANYESLRFAPRIEESGQKIVRLLKGKGKLVVLHLRYEMDMLAFSGCSHGCTDNEAEELTKMRYDYPWWKEKVINSTQKRLDGLCPLTPEETMLVLRALGFGNETQIYIAAGEIYGSERRMAPMRAAFPNIVKKEMLLSSEELEHFQNHSSQMAALDYLVAVESDVFIPTYDGNMAKVVEGHRRYLGYRKTLLLDRRKLVELIDLYQSNQLTWEGFSLAVKEHHENYTGSPTKRIVIPERPKEEDYFYANPQECLA